MTTFLVFHIGDEYTDIYQVEAPTPLDAVRQAHKKSGSRGEYYVAPKDEVVRIEVKMPTEPLFDVTTEDLMGELLKKPASPRPKKKRSH